MRRAIIKPSTATPPSMVPKYAISNLHGAFNAHDGNRHATQYEPFHWKPFTCIDVLPCLHLPH